MKLRRIWPYVVLLVLVAASVLLFVQRVWVLDWVRLRNYDAPVSVAQLAADTTMTPYAKRLFYVNRPALEDKAAFNQHCADRMEHSVVLGCYHGDRRGIYLYDVADERLAGVKEVTAAHEMLHQAYDRLGQQEKARIHRLLQSFNDSGLTDQSVREKLDLYRQANTPDLVNEMHSIFGTEVADLPTELEAYYQQYFTDRQQVVRLSRQYRTEFERLRQEVASYDMQLAALESQIEAAKEWLDSELAVIRANERELRRGPQGSIESYNAEVRAYNQRIDAYNVRVESVRDDIEQYNSIVAKRNAIAVEERQLQQALDSRLTPVAQ